MSCSGVSVASNCWTRSALVTTETAGGERVAEPGVELLPTGVDDLAAGQRVEAVALDGVDDADGLADDGHVVEPAARGDPRGRQAQDAVGERVAAAEVVE